MNFRRHAVRGTFPGLAYQLGNLLVVAKFGDSSEACGTRYSAGISRRCSHGRLLIAALVAIVTVSRKRSQRRRSIGHELGSLLRGYCTRAALAAEQCRARPSPVPAFGTAAASVASPSRQKSHSLPPALWTAPGGSPIPPGASWLGTMCTSTLRHVRDPQHRVTIEIGSAASGRPRMVISSYSAEVRPNTTPPSICAATRSGLITCPQSTATTTRSTRNVPSFATVTSATCAI